MKRIVTEEQFQDFEQMVADGWEPYMAAREAGTTLTALRSKRGDRERYEKAMEVSAEAREAIANHRMEQWAKVDDSPQVRIAYAKAESKRYRQAERLELTGGGGGPIAVEGRAVVGLADVIAFAREIGAAADLGLDAGDPRGELPAASEVLPDSR